MRRLAGGRGRISMSASLTDFYVGCKSREIKADFMIGRLSNLKRLVAALDHRAPPVLVVANWARGRESCTLCRRAKAYIQ